MENKIRVLRAELRISQEELAEKSGVSRTTISNLESGNATITTNVVMEKIAKGLNSDVPYVFFSN